MDGVRVGVGVTASVRVRVGATLRWAAEASVRLRPCVWAERNRRKSWWCRRSFVRLQRSKLASARNRSVASSRQDWTKLDARPAFSLPSSTACMRGVTGVPFWRWHVGARVAVGVGDEPRKPAMSHVSHGSHGICAPTSAPRARVHCLCREGGTPADDRGRAGTRK